MKPGARRAERRWPIQVFRIASLVVPSAVAWNVAFSAPHPSRLTEAVTYLLGPLWLAVAGALVFRTVDALLRRGRDVPLLDRIDVLTETGSSLIWTAAAAVVGSVLVGYASLAVVGLMGLVLAHLVVLWTLLRVSGDDPLRRSAVSRRFVPRRVVEGEPVTEELRLSGVRIPVGFRLFASGRIGPRWPISRYVVEADASGGEVLLEAQVGPAHRGEHRAEPLELWLQDVFGLCHSVRVRVEEGAPAGLTVLPRLRPVESTPELLSLGGHDKEPRPAPQLPTEGTFKLREYAPGDDARRIHWVRSLGAQQVVVRMPDELPPDRPHVRLVLDTYLHGAGELSCNAPHDLLDALVQVWLGVGRALVEAGARVTLVTAAPQDSVTAAAGSRVSSPPTHPTPKPPAQPVAMVRRRLTPQSLSLAQGLGAQVRWQDVHRVGDLLSREASMVVSYRLQPDPEEAGKVAWILVPMSTWVSFDDALPPGSGALLPYPMGSADNRSSRRARERRRFVQARRDRATFIEQCMDARRRDQPPAAAFVARPAPRMGIRLEVVR